MLMLRPQAAFSRKPEARGDTAVAVQVAPRRHAWRYKQHRLHRKGPAISVPSEAHNHDAGSCFAGAARLLEWAIDENVKRLIDNGRVGLVSSTRWRWGRRRPSSERQANTARWTNARVASLPEDFGSRRTDWTALYGVLLGHVCRLSHRNGARCSGSGRDERAAGT